MASRALFIALITIVPVFQRPARDESGKVELIDKMIFKSFGLIEFDDSGGGADGFHFVEQGGVEQGKVGARKGAVSDHLYLVGLESGK